MNDIRQYDELADVWWDLTGPFATLHWIARARAALVPHAPTPSILLDLACGAGLLAPHVAPKNYLHIGLDMTTSALTQAADHGVVVLQGDVCELPIADESVDVVCAGEILEHVTDVEAVIAESCRVLKPGGLVVLDTLADTPIGKFLAVTVAERIPGGAPKGIHDPALFVNRRALIQSYARHGVSLQLRGLRPSFLSLRPWRSGWQARGRMVSTRMTHVLFQGWGRKVG